jgi:hypothetical protein
MRNDPDFAWLPRPGTLFSGGNNPVPVLFTRAQAWLAGKDAPEDFVQRHGDVALEQESAGAAACWALRCSCGWRQLHSEMLLMAAEMGTNEVLWDSLREHLDQELAAFEPLDLAWMRGLGWFEPDPPLPVQAMTQWEKLARVWKVVDDALGAAHKRLQQPPSTATEAVVRARNGL